MITELNHIVCEQGSEIWKSHRVGKCTASRFADVLSPSKSASTEIVLNDNQPEDGKMTNKIIHHYHFRRKKMTQEIIDKYNCNRCKKRVYSDEQITKSEKALSFLDTLAKDLICDDCCKEVKKEKDAAQYVIYTENRIKNDLKGLNTPKFIELSDSDLDPSNNKPVKDLMKFLVKEDKTWCFYLFGDYGCGKTHLVYWVLKRAIKNKIFVDNKTFCDSEYNYDGNSVDCVEAGHVVSLYQAEYRKKEGDSEKAIKRYRQASVLFIDDLGAERDTDDSRRIVEDLLCYRYNNSLKTIITANIPAKDMSSRYSGRLASRLNAGENCVLLHEDRRCHS